MKVYSIAPDGSALTYAILSAGDSFGETTILTGHWVRATVEALEPTEVRYLSADQFETLLREHPDFALALLRNLAERIRQSEERVFHISRLKLGQRVAHALIGLAQTIGEQTDDRHRNPPHPPRDRRLCGREPRSGQPHARTLGAQRLDRHQPQVRHHQRPTPVPNHHQPNAHRRIKKRVERRPSPPDRVAR
jgi:CRP/FNR family transcriptional regulator, cyclic AMP receptor protein